MEGRLGIENKCKYEESLADLISKDVNTRLGWIVKMPVQDGKVMLAAAVTISRTEFDFEQQILNVIAYRDFSKKGKAPWIGPQETADKRNKIGFWLNQNGYGDVNNYLARFDVDIPKKYVYDTVLNYINGKLNERFRKVAKELMYNKIGNYIKNRNPTLKNYDSTNPDREIEVETEDFNLKTSLKTSPIIPMEEFLQDVRASMEDFYNVIPERSPEEIERENAQFQSLSSEEQKKFLKSYAMQEKIEKNRLARLWQDTWAYDANYPLNLLLAQVYTPANAIANAKCSISSNIKKLVDLKGMPQTCTIESPDYASTKTVNNLQYDIFHLQNFRKNFLHIVIRETARDVQGIPTQNLKDIESAIENGYESRDHEILEALRLKALEIFSQKFIGDILKSGYQFNFLDTTPFLPLLVWDQDCSRLIVMRPYAENYNFSEFECNWKDDKKLTRTERQMKEDFVLRHTYYNIVRERAGLGLTQLISVEAKDEKEAKKQLQQYSLTNIFK